jgi:hypothetical protein
MNYIKADALKKAAEQAMGQCQCIYETHAHPHPHGKGLKSTRYAWKSDELSLHNWHADSIMVVCYECWTQIPVSQRIRQV